MKVLYLGVYRQPTGWGQAAVDYILSMDTVGIDVIPRPIYFGNSNCKVPQRIEELERSNTDGVTHIVQHILPHHFEYHAGFKNIGLYASETACYDYTSWTDHIELMDEIWVINQHQKIMLDTLNIKKPIKVIPHATNIERFCKSYKPLEDIKNGLCGNFTFYTIGEMVRRKNLMALLKAFHIEFETFEPVSLLIKTSKGGLDPFETAKHVEAFCGEIKKGLKLYRNIKDYHRENVITHRFSPEGMMRLHATCDCFVQPSYGEAWSIPAFDAMAMGKTPIVTQCTGYKDYISNKEGWLVPANPEPVFAEHDTFADLFTGREDWYSVNINELRKAMREAYTNHQLRKEKSLAGIERAYDFTYESIGNLIKDTLIHG